MPARKDEDDTPFTRYCSRCDLNRRVTLLQPSDFNCLVCSDVQFGLWRVGQKRRRWVLKQAADEFYLSMSHEDQTYETNTLF